jgi:hypothetical protein
VKSIVLPQRFPFNTRKRVRLVKLRDHAVSIAGGKPKNTPGSGRRAPGNRLPDETTYVYAQFLGEKDNISGWN